MFVPSPPPSPSLFLYSDDVVDLSHDLGVSSEGRALTRPLEGMSPKLAAEPETEQVDAT